MLVCLDTRGFCKQVTYIEEDTQCRDERNKLNGGVLYANCICLCSHMIILLVMFFVSGCQFVSEILLHTIWYSGTMTMLFLIEHVAWVYVLWVLSCEPPPYWRLTIAYLGVLLAIISWVMEIVVPINPNIMGLHSKFCIVFVVGCLINLIGSVLSLPGSVTVGSFKTIMIGFGGLAVSSCAAWYGARTVGKHSGHEPTLEIVAYLSYLSSLLTGFIWALQTHV